MTRRLSVLIADDERLARRRLRRLLGSIDGVDVVGEAANGDEAIAAIRELEPRVVLLDVQMPGPDGFGVIERLPKKPLVIFVTAFAEFALRAFDVQAVDYLLKPVSREKLARAIDRARAVLEPRAPAAFPSLLAVRSQGRVDLVDVGAIDWLEAADNYVVVHAGARTFIARDTLTRIESTLDSRLFARIHRGTIVRIDRVAALEVANRGDYVAVLKDGTRLGLSRRFRPRLNQVLEG
ncbi:MAG TPA: LytTR family DNA-binding domain-containing protein [Vicinamibacterales bacterium]|nr:LytTR family DNA-binding domain-containing protein [Vicinamibacterales bacterium]